MTRRLLVILVLIFLGWLAAAPAARAGGDIACVYNRTPLHLGICVSLP
jgi:hypothetical protein